MKYLPLFLDLKNKETLIVGGGQVALRKADLLMAAGAKVTILAPEIDSALLQAADEHKLQIKNEFYDSALLKQMNPILIIAATNNQQVNNQVYEDAKRSSILCNTVDQPALSSAIFPAIVNRNPVQIAISTGGSSPTLARFLRTKIEQILPEKLGAIADWLANNRFSLKEKITSVEHRQRFWDIFLTRVLHTKDVQQIKSLDDHLDQLITEFTVSNQLLKGQVFLIGVGPGDPDLLTLKALRLMQQMDVVIYDRLVSPAIMDLVRRDATKIYVGKKRDLHTVPQDEINQLLIDLAKDGKKVGRLKGGDPFIFGRGGEEVSELAEAGIDYEVIPGITAGSGCATYAGIPLTHRDYAQSVRFVTAHLKDGVPELPWHELIFPFQTLVIYMGLYHLPLTIESLLQNGLPSDWPIALVSKGTTLEQQILFGTLDTILDKLRQMPLQSPTIIIVGQVVTLSPYWQK